MIGSSSFFQQPSAAPNSKTTITEERRADHLAKLPTYIVIGTADVITVVTKLRERSQQARDEMRTLTNNPNMHTWLDMADNIIPTPQPRAARFSKPFAAGG